MGTLEQQVTTTQKQLARIHWRRIPGDCSGSAHPRNGCNFSFPPVPGISSWGFENIAIGLSLHAGHGFSSLFFEPSGPIALIPPGYPLFLACFMRSR
jgi:hypothetical protein